METKNEKEVDALNNLLEYTNDRVDGYSKAVEETDQNDLKEVFNKYSSQSRQFSQELKNRVIELGGVPVSGTTNSGKVYRAWMDVKAALTGKDRKAILGSCEYGEDVAVQSYEKMLERDDLSSETRLLLAEQARHVRNAHDEIKAMRDMASA
jgi:uncharacterized protein (TIGR02284 family)